ncbi:M60 family peptidase N-terminal accessory domain-containing protein, partial [Bacillus sp. D-CC]
MQVHMAVEDKEKQQEERVYQLLPKGDVEGMRELHQRGMSFSPYEPTGIYVKPDEEVVIQVEGNQQIKLLRFFLFIRICTNISFNL